ncbi:MAG TPA: O-succinylhomoserine sulfhydrylase [Gammaproteobacteria bacterium]|nr:O-succinylhomoserine sulfhydrylase [Gammaproteobacteria bacterium]
MSENNSDNTDYKIATRAVRTGQIRSQEGEHSDPIFLTSSYVFKSAADAAAKFSGEVEGNIYSRFTNPTVRTFEERLAAMEEGECCVATATGMSAIVATCMGLLNAGDHVVAGRDLFGSTIILFNNILTRFDLSFTYVDSTDLSQWRDAIQDNTKMLFLETPSNPLCNVSDIRAVAKIAHKNQALLVVDNTFCTPVLQQPLKLGADVVVHSSTKYIDGQGRTMGGAVVGNKEQVGESVYAFLRSAGPSLSPFNAWVQMKGLETLIIRMKAHSRHALKVASWLEAQPSVERVFYPDLPSHPQHALAQSQQNAAAGVLAFQVKGGRDEAWAVIDNTKLFSITANLGDTKSTITHPATTTHGRLTVEQRDEMGVFENLLRLSIGLEDVDDLQKDLQRGLDLINL